MFLFPSVQYIFNFVQFKILIIEIEN